MIRIYARYCNLDGDSFMGLIASVSNWESAMRRFPVTGTVKVSRVHGLDTWVVFDFGVQS